jgi:hypothetical protein
MRRQPVPKRLTASAVVLAAVAAALLILVLPGPPQHLARHRAPPHALNVPSPSSVVVGTLVASNLHGLRFGTPVPAQGASCSLGACWSTLVTASGYLYPVQGSYDYPVQGSYDYPVSDVTTTPWHVVGPALAGPGVNPRDHFISVDSRSTTRALIWTGRNTFVSTHDGGRHWYRVTRITHHVAVGDAGAQVVSITIGLPGPHACDYYFTYSSAAGTVWRRGGALSNFMTTVMGPQTPSCLGDEPLARS